jgi:hypothetical protein
MQICYPVWAVVMWEKRTYLFEMTTRGQQMSCGRPETLCYLSGGETTQKLPANKSWEAAARDLPSSVCPGWRTLVSSMSCRLQMPLNGVETPTTTGILWTLVTTKKFGLNIIFPILKNKLLYPQNCTGILTPTVCSWFGISNSLNPPLFA